MPVRVTVEGATGFLTLDRPGARNALSIEMCDAITDGISRLCRREDVRAVVVHGTGRAFCSGADVAALRGDDAPRFLEAFERMLDSVWRARLPTVAAIQGAALGGGFQLATVCDFRLAELDAKLGIPAARLGIVVNFENIERLVGLAGPVTARQMLLAGRVFSGEEASSRGLADAVEAPALAAATSLASALCGFAPLSVQGAKAALITIADAGGARARDPAGAAAHDARVIEAYASDDLAEGLSALSEKRAAEWRGR